MCAISIISYDWDSSESEGKKFSTTYAIVLFFFSPPFRKISNFSKTVHRISIKFCTVISHPKGPLHAQRHQNRLTGMRETQPKLAQKWPKNSHFRTFFDFLKNSPYDSNEIFYSHSTPYYGPLCAISSNSYD